ncbi:DUF1572 family protein [Granulicella sp. L46]|uniref:DUF1572 family protein n=1 Tax=Granulicella sp. L46 TaxID=1641865 RepID=UPI00131B9ED6|nr:DUF1572 family protein [Granulicella sp. L46]
MSSNPVADNFLDYAAKRLHQSQKSIAACLDKLTDNQIWHRNGDHENSIANLLLHLEGNMRQWILHGIADQPDVRQRDEEFTLIPSTNSAEARARFNATLDESARVIAALSPERLLTVIDPQPTGTWRHTTTLEAIFRVVGHVEMHTGQIILLTKQLTATDLDLSMPRKR